MGDEGDYFGAEATLSRIEELVERGWKVTFQHSTGVGVRALLRPGLIGPIVGGSGENVAQALDAALENYEDHETAENV